MAPRGPPPDFWRLMPRKLALVAPDTLARERLEAALAPAAARANCYSFVVEAGTLPDYLLQLFTAKPPNTAIFAFIFRVGRYW